LDETATNIGSKTIDTTGNLVMGYLYSLSSGIYNFKGFIDEVKIYPYARTAAQIKTDYNAGLAGVSSASGISVAMGGQSKKSLSDGLVGYWKMDEASWSGLADEVIDSSGNGNYGTVQNGGTTTSTAKYGMAGEFDGSAKVFATDTIGTAEDGFTIGAWIHSTSTAQSQQIVYLGPIQLRDTIFYTSTSDGWQSISFSRPSINNWHYISGTFDGEYMRLYIDGEFISDRYVEKDIYNGSTFFMGGRSGDTVENFLGQIDEVRIYNRALSSREVKQLYEYAPGPAGYWDFDEKEGTTIYDKSGNENNLTKGNIGGVDAGESYYSLGAIGGGYRFFSSIGSGNGDYFKTDSDSCLYRDLNCNTKTISFFVKPEAIDEGYSSGGVMGTTYSIGNVNTAGGWIISLSGDNLRFQFRNFSGSIITISTVIEREAWQHITVIADDEYVAIYKNGIFQDSESSFGGFNSTKGSISRDYLTIGAGIPMSHLYGYNGSIDEVKIYNYARTQKQILEDMNGGRPASKSPVAYWKFDEGYGTTVNDSGDRGNDGIISGATTNGAIWTNDGKVGKGLEFSSNQESLFLDYTVWADGQTGSVTGFNRNGDITENYRIIDEDPWGRKVAVWEARADATSGADGGWSTSSIAIDQIKMYRFSTWIRRTVLGNGTYYLGTRGSNSGGTNIGVLNRTNGAVNTNPYFRATSGNGILSTDSWFLLVGHVWPEGSGTGSTYIDTGLYNSSGTKIATPYDFVWQDGTFSTVHRTYLYYSTDISTRQQWVYPRVDVIDGTEPSIQDLLDGHDKYGDDVFLEVEDDKESFSFWYDKDSSGTWKHIVNSLGVYYVDGQLSTPDEYPVYMSGDEIYLGRTTSSNFVDGKIDEFKVFNYALSEDEVRQEYNQGKAIVLGSEKNSSSTWDDGGFGGDAPIAHWNFEEGSGTTANDISGNGNTGTLTSMDDTDWVLGKPGWALDFDGNSDYVGYGNICQFDSSFSASVWVKVDSNQVNRLGLVGNAIYQGGGWFIGVNVDGSPAIFALNSDTTEYVITGTQDILDEWTHLSLVFDGSTMFAYVNGKMIGSKIADVSINGGNFLIGKGTQGGWGNYLLGSIDEVKVYDYARTPAQVAFDYNKGKPIGHWTFDDGEGTNLNDISGNDNDGILTTMDPATDWLDGSDCKFEGCLDFDGSNDWVDIGITRADIIDGNTFTVSWWAQTSYVGTESITSFLGDWYLTHSANNYKGRYHLIGLTTTEFNSNISINDGEWHYFSLSYDGSYVNLYIDGILDINEPASGTLSATDIFHIGDRDGSYKFDGKIDEFKVYNYALSEQQVKEAYNGGLMRFK